MSTRGVRAAVRGNAGEPEAEEEMAPEGLPTPSSDWLPRRSSSTPKPDWFTARRDAVPARPPTAKTGRLLGSIEPGETIPLSKTRGVPRDL